MLLQAIQPIDSQNFPLHSDNIFQILLELKNFVGPRNLVMRGVVETKSFAEVKNVEVDLFETKNAG